MTGWFLHKFYPDTGRTIHMMIDDEGNIHVRDRQPIQKIVDENTELRNEWDGWKGKKYGAVTNRIPEAVFFDLRKKCGFDGVEYDRKKMNSILKDIDYRKFQTVRGTF